MRVLQLSWEYPPVIEGGLGRHVHRLSRALVEQGVDVDVLTRGPRDEGVAVDERDGGVAVHRVALGPFAYDVDAFLRWVAAMNDALLTRATGLVADGGFDLVHSHDWLVADAARAICASAGLPWLVTVHATEHGRHAGRVGQPPQSTIHAAECAMVRDADHLIACSQWMRDHLTGVLGVADDRITALRNGIDVAQLTAARSTSRPAAPAGARIVLLAGRLVYEKGFDLALAALAPILARHDALRIVVAGDGPAAGELGEQTRRLGLGDRVEFRGWIGDDALHALMRRAEMCVVPSRYEPFGIVALEAMALGCPCVVADVGGLAEIVPDDAGVRVAADDVDALAGALARMLDGGEDMRARIGARARRHARGFDWSQVARDTLAVYRAVAAAPAPA